MNQPGTTPRAFLFLQAKQRVYRFQFTKDLTHIGSHSDNDIVIRDSSVLSEHARISKANDVFTVRPIGESEVRANDELIDSSHELENGDWLEVGDVSILFAKEFAESPVTVHLLIRRPDEPPMGFWTSKSTIIIGREQGDVIINDPQLSKAHAIIENFCIGGWFVLNAQRDGNTAINGKNIDARHALRDGDIVTLGNIEIEFRSRPFENPTGQEAARLAAERVDKLRALNSSQASRAKENYAPRNPYQRYPPRPSRKTANGQPTEVRDDSPNRPPSTLSQGRKSWTVRPHTAARQDRKNERTRRPTVGTLPPTRTQVNQRQSLRSGLETGIFQSRTGVARDRRTSRNRTPIAASENSTGTGRDRVTEGSRHLHTRKPHTHPIDGPTKRSFAERSEQNTRLSYSDSRGSGLWYLPSGEEHDGQRRILEAPIIAARGDEVPIKPPPIPSSQHHLKTRGAIGKERTASNRLEPMPDIKQAPEAGGKAAAHTKGRSQKSSRHASEQSKGDIPLNGLATPGRRPDDSERWYTPGQKKKHIRREEGPKAWYLPKNTTDSNSDNLDHPPSEPDGRGGTQVLDTEDY